MRNSILFWWKTLGVGGGEEIVLYDNISFARLLEVLQDPDLLKIPVQ